MARLLWSNTAPPAAREAAISPPRRPRLHSSDKPNNNNRTPAKSASAASSTTASTTTTTEYHYANSANEPLPRSPRRGRINSRDIPRTYSGLYGKEDDFLPLECHRQQRGAIISQSIWFLLGSYLSLIAVVQQLVSSVLPWSLSWTCTHAIHLVVTIVHIHWLKGSMFDPQGEMNALTIWEQLEARGSQAKAVRQLLLLVPTALCYAACQFGEFGADLCAANLVLWSIAMLAKMPCMNGVRIFGINRTVGIDDVAEPEEEEDMDGSTLKKER